MRGAGGTSGGLSQFFIGLTMLCGGGYLLLSSITVTTNFGLGAQLYRFSANGSGYGITSGMIMIPFMFGVGIVFYNSRNWLGWLLTIGPIVALVFGVVSSIRFNMRTMSAFDLITILVLAVGGLGLFLRSLKTFDNEQIS